MKESNLTAIDYKKLPSYFETIKSLAKKNRQVHLLLGNGFSMSYDSKIFSYNALSKFIDSLKNDILKQLFGIVKTNNFESVMQQLDNFSKIAAIFGADEKFIKKIEDSTQTLKESLINAVKELHPEHVFTIEEKRSAVCASFLNYFIEQGGNIFTTNYDLLLYWVLMRNDLIENKIDGFGREAEESFDFVPANEVEYSELRWGKYKEEQNVHYLHGALQLFDTGLEIVKEEYTAEHLLLANIEERFDRKEYPIFVTAGNGEEKLTHIMHNRYLTFCYEKLSTITGSLISYGFNFGEYDKHIIAAINKATVFREDTTGKQNKLWSIYIGVYSEADFEHIKSIESKFKCKVNIFDAKTANVWG